MDRDVRLLSRSTSTLAQEPLFCVAVTPEPDYGLLHRGRSSAKVTILFCGFEKSDPHRALDVACHAQLPMQLAAQGRQARTGGLFMAATRRLRQAVLQGPGRHPSIPLLREIGSGRDTSNTPISIIPLLGEIGSLIDLPFEGNNIYISHIFYNI